MHAFKKQKTNSSVLSHSLLGICLKVSVSLCSADSHTATLLPVQLENHLFFRLLWEKKVMKYVVYIWQKIVGT